MYQNDRLAVSGNNNWKAVFLSKFNTTIVVDVANDYSLKNAIKQRTKKQRPVVAVV